jgi:hypothetical protein
MDMTPAAELAADLTAVTISIKRLTLTDGSHAFDVNMGGVNMPAVTEKDALALADKIALAIKQHTNCEPRFTMNY